MVSPCPALHQSPAVTPLFCSKCPLTPNIQGVAALGHQFLDIVHSLLLVHLAIFSYNLIKGILHIPGHVARITTHIDVTISFVDQLPDMLLVLFEQMLHINLFWLVPRKSHIELSKCSFFDKFGKFFLIDVVLLLVPAAKIQHSLPNLLALLFEPAPLLDETNEGSDPCAWPNHDDRSVRFERQPELGFPDIQGHCGFVPILIELLVHQPVSSHTFVYSVRFGSVLHDNGTDMDRVWVYLGCRSDGIIASLKTGKQFTKVVNRRPQRRGVLQDSQDIPPGLNNPAEIQSLAFSRRGSHLAQLLLLTGICGILCQLIENVCTWWISDIQIVGQGCAV
uniref:Uncharacterized protein n=1 Tax=Micrurus paraensis TaxID=1970185 RepID=A0A2D4KUZ7_9SAUR